VRLSQIRLLVSDPARSFRFYREVLGLQLAYGAEGDPYASFAAGHGTIAIFTRSGQSEVVDLRPAGDGAVVVLEIYDLEAEAERLGERLEGGITDRPDWGIRVAHLRDPDGNLVELVEPLRAEEGGV
jgi:catechol 2,3-dioxygenase-like lactoylglutathione lyase family enzyme